MALLEPGKTYVPKNAAEVRRTFLTDIELAARDAGVDDPPVEPNGDWYVMGSAIGQMAMLVHANVRIGEDNSSVLTATGARLDAIREADGLPVVPASPSTGSVIVKVAGGGAQTVPEGLQGKLPNGKRFKAASTVLGATTGAEVPIITIDTGADTAAPANTVLTWLSPPGLLQTECRVSPNDPLSGGTDEENDERKRDRILNRRRNAPAGENWGRIIELGLNASGGVQSVFVFPGLGGPSSRKVVLCKDIDPANGDYSRAPSSALVELVRQALHAQLGGENETIVQAVADEFVDVAILATVPDALSIGGNGQGWLDAAPWPPLEGGDTRVRVTDNTAGSANHIEVDASTATAPIAGQTHVSWWSTYDQRFYSALVIGVSGSAGAWELELDKPFADSLGQEPAIGDYISPTASNTEAYGERWRELMRRFGPGENTTDGWRLPRARRHPFTSDAWRSDLGLVTLKDLLANFDEITDADWSYRSLTTPTVPAGVVDPPNVLRLRHFGIYQQ